MKACELMVGDWVSVTAEDGITYNGKVDSIGILRDLNMKATLVRVYIDEDKRIYVDMLLEKVKPISLTEEKLKANGWNKNGAYNDYILRGDIYDFIGYNADNNHVSINIDGRNVKQKVYVSANFVHELQHALRCCGLLEMADNFKIN